MNPERDVLPKCDKCGQPNLIATWSNYCQPCREAYHARVSSEAAAQIEAADKYWRDHGYPSRIS